MKSFFKFIRDKVNYIKNVLKDILSEYSVGYREHRYWCINDEIYNLAWNYIDKVCRDVCQQLNITVKVCKEFNPVETGNSSIDYSSHNDKFKQNDGDATIILGLYTPKDKIIYLLTDDQYANKEQKYRTWIHEIGHYFESNDRDKKYQIYQKGVDDLISYINQFQDYYREYGYYKEEFSNIMKEVEIMRHLNRVHYFEYREAEDLREFNATREGFDYIIRKLPAWVLITCVIGFHIYFKEFFPYLYNNILYDDHICENDKKFDLYMNYFNLTEKDIVESWREYDENRK